MKNNVKPKSENQKLYLQSLQKNKITFCEGPAGSGKAQPLDAIVYCPEGSRLMGDLKIGDKVLTPYGSSSKINGIYPQNKRKVYRITFRDGSYVESCKEHLWKVYDSVLQKDVIIDTQTILEEYETDWGRKRYHIELPAYANFKKQEIDIDPYLLGALIGDGGLTQQIMVSTADSQILKEIKNVLPENHKIKKRKHGKYNYSITSPRGQDNVLMDQIRQYGLNVKSEYKFIPSNYKYNTVEVRLGILQGLLDTDGSVTISYKKGKPSSSTIEFSTTAEKLAYDVQEIVESLGGTCRITSRYSNYTYKGKKKTGLKSYRCYIKLETQKPFRLHRKVNKIIKKTKYLPKRIIVNVECVRIAETQCISIEHSQHLYLTNHFVPTHNTYLAAMQGMLGLLDGKYHKLIISRPLVQSGEDTGYLPGDINAKLDPYVKPIYDIFDYAVSKGDLQELIKDGRIEIVPFAYMRGRNFFNSYIILDEVQNCSYSQLKLALTRFAKNSKMVLTGDSDQSDLPMNQQGGFLSIINILKDTKDIGIVGLNNSDIIREPIVRTILEKLDGLEK